MAGALFAFTLADWASLALLPRLRRSFGPVNPPLLALSWVRAGLVSMFGLLWETIGVALAVQGALLAVSLYATWIEPFRLRVTYQTLVSPRLSPEGQPIRLLHLGDLHIERLTRREAEVQRLIDELAPDLILFSGDFVNLSYQHDALSAKHIREVVGRWHARLGVYCVSGTPLVETSEDVERFVEGTRLRWLRDEVVSIDVDGSGGQQLKLLGLDGAMWREDTLPRLHATARELSGENGLRVLLYHTPDVAPEAAELGFDMYLCGHTHGGQLRLPLYGAIVTASEFGKRFEMGRYQVGQMALYVTRGLGMEGGAAPRARFLCPPEMTLWTLRGVLD
jgi:predicted MPP superfamily phosphohydrolase